jgi:hypothetical protein
MKNIVKIVLLSVALSIACFGVVMPFSEHFPTQLAIASNVVVSKQTPSPPTVTLIGEIESRRSYQLTIDSSDDQLYVQCPANHTPKFGYIRNVETIWCERFQPAQ